jgi:hypothetical protein
LNDRQANFHHWYVVSARPKTERSPFMSPACFSSNHFVISLLKNRINAVKYAVHGFIHIRHCRYVPLISHPPQLQDKWVIYLCIVCLNGRCYDLLIPTTTVLISAFTSVAISIAIAITITTTRRSRWSCRSVGILQNGVLSYCRRLPIGILSNIPLAIKYRPMVKSVVLATKFPVGLKSGWSRNGHTSCSWPIRLHPWPIRLHPSLVVFLSLVCLVWSLVPKPSCTRVMLLCQVLPSMNECGHHVTQPG